jgi:hypothetical protein
LASIISPILLRLYDRIIRQSAPPDGVVDVHPDGTLRWTDAAGDGHVLHVDVPASEPPEVSPDELVAMLEAMNDPPPRH